MTHARTRTGPTAIAARRAAVVPALALAVAGVSLVALSSTAQAATRTDADTETLRTAAVKLTNEARAAKDCRPLKVSGSLTTAAQRHADDMATNNYFSHTSLDGRSWETRIRAAGWKKPGGENIAFGFDLAQSVLQGWMDSPAHRRNIVDCKFNYIGIGYSADGEYWVQDFGY